MNSILPPRTADTMSEAIAMSSPSGRMSRRAYAQASRRLAESLFGSKGGTREAITGESVPRRERLEATAAGHPDNPSVQAARRILECMGDRPSDTLQPLLGAPRANLPPRALTGFLEYAATECGDDFEDPFVEPVPDPEPDPWTGFLPGELPETLPEAPQGATRSEIPEIADLPAVGPDSETAGVAAWCVAAGLQASVVGQWVWCDPFVQVGRDREALDRLLRAAGFGFSGRRQSYYHACGVSCRRQPGDKRRGGKLERFHNTVAAGEYKPGTFNPAPAWKQAKQAKAKARRKTR